MNTTTSKKSLNRCNHNFVRIIKNDSRVWFDRRPLFLDDDDSDFDPYYFDDDAFDFVEDRFSCEVAVHAPFRSLTSGTTATSPAMLHDGVFSRPVYYDWGANFEKVLEIITHPEVQESLKVSIIQASKEPSTGYYGYAELDKRTIWPFLFCLDVRRNCVVKAGLKKNFLSKDIVKQCNGRIANWYASIGKRLIKEDRISILEAELMHGINLMSVFESGRKLRQLLLKSIDKELFKSNGALKELLLFAPKKTNAFKPFLYKLAEMLSPFDTKLTVYESETYSVVVDEKRNIVFDNFLYFNPNSCNNPFCDCCGIYEALVMASDGRWRNIHASRNKTNMSP